MLDFRSLQMVSASFSVKAICRCGLILWTWAIYRRAGKFEFGRFDCCGHQNRLHMIERTLHPAPATIEYMRVNHRRLYILVPQQLLHRANVVIRFEQMRRE